MNCERFEQELAISPVVNDAKDLEPEQAAHVLTCARCRTALRERIALDRVLGLDGAVSPPDDLVVTVKRLVGSSPASTAPARPRRSRFVPISLAAAALFFVVWSLHRDRSGVVEFEPAGPDEEMLAHVDLLLDWELLAEHGADLDLIAADELLAAVENGDEG